VSELGPNAFGELPEPGRVDCYLALPLPTEEAGEGSGGVLVVAPRWLLHPAVPQPAGSLVYELATGHPDRQPGELVFPVDLTEELRVWPQERWIALGVDLRQVANAVVGCWQRGDFRKDVLIRLEAGANAQGACNGRPSRSLIGSTSCGRPGRLCVARSPARPPNCTTGSSRPDRTDPRPGAQPAAPAARPD